MIKNKNSEREALKTLMMGKVPYATVSLLTGSDIMPTPHGTYEVFRWIDPENGEYELKEFKQVDEAVDYFISVR